MAAALALSAAAQTNRLNVVVVEGQGAIHNVKRGTAFEPVIEVRDSTGRPVTEASVTFTTPSTGPSATFPDGSHTLMLLTERNGRAVARGLRPNTFVGPYEIRVIAKSGGDTGTAVISQTNAAPASAMGSSGKKWALILGVIGAAAAGGLIASGGAGGSRTASATDPPDTGGSVTPGAPGFGPPR